MRSTRALLAAAGLALSANVAAAQLTSNTPTVTLNATQQETLTLTPSAGSTNAGPINPTGVTAFTPLNMTLDWNLGTAATVDVVGWFNNPAAALTSGGNNIPTSNVEGRTGANPFAPFVNNGVAGTGVVGASLNLWQVAAATGVGTASSQLDLQLNLASAPPAGAYTGTLNLRAVVQ